MPDDRLTAYQVWLVLLTALTIVFDGIDNQLLGVSIPVIMKEWSASRAAFAPVMSLGYAGMMAGGAGAGLAGDRFGRRTALLCSMVVFGGATLASTLAHSTPVLGALRFVAGIGLGGALPNAGTLAAEYVPRSKRPLAVTATIVCVPLGATLAGVLGTRVLEGAGWRALFAIGGAAPVFLAAILFFVLPESPRYLARRAEPGAVAPRAPVSRLFEPGLRRDTIALWASFVTCLLAVYLGFSWLPSLLAGAGFTPAVASSGITAFNIGGVAGALAGGWAFLRVGSRPAMIAMALGAIAGAVALSVMDIHAGMPRVTLFALLTLSGGLINAVQTTMYALAANVYPTAMRATGIGLAMAFGRLGAILSGYAGAWAIDYRGSLSYFGLMAAAMTLCLVALSSIQRHVQPSR